MDAGGASRFSSGSAAEHWAGTKPVARRNLQTCRAALVEMVAGQKSFDRGSEEAGLGRSEVYWYLYFLSEELKPISDGVRVSPPRAPKELDKIKNKLDPLFVDLVVLFGHARNAFELVDDDISAFKSVQVEKLMDAQELLVGAIAGYSDVLEGIVGGSANRSKAREDFIAAFRQFQNKLELIVEGLEDWRR